jgi:chemosensory pili system protein ChpA (sensor histidine kinase/response regulator)
LPPTEISPVIQAESAEAIRNEAESETVSIPAPDEEVELAQDRSPPSEKAAQEAAFVEVGSEEELVEIFLEEARELLDSLDTSLAAWRQAPQDNTPLAELQRTLHTLKGGARLVGITPVGDLGHTFESLLTGITSGQVVTTDAVQQLAQQVADRLSSQVDEVSESGRVQEAQDLITQLELLLAGELQPASGAGLGDEAVKAVESDLDEGPAEATGVEQPTGTEDAESEARASAGEDALAAAETEPLVLARVEPEIQPPPVIESAEVVNLFGADAGRDTAPELQEQPAPEDKASTAGTVERIVEPLAPQKPGAKATSAETKPAPKHEQVRVRSDVLDRLVNNAGEVSIYRARLEQQNSAIGFNLSELEQTVARLRQQLRQLEMETEAQILFRYEREKEETGGNEEVFDPLEMDRFSTMQQVSRSLMETVNDLISIKDLTEDLNRETETLLMQQARVSTDLQDGLLRTRMVPFTQIVSRLQRLVRQTCDSVHKQAELTVNGAAVEVDRSILERMVAPLEHILRNAVSHGIETPETRRGQGKKAKGRITLDLSREGTDVVLVVCDDGQGLKLENIRKQAIAKGLLEEGANVADNDVMQFILEPGFSTADKVSQIAGRGVGMDVVVSEVKQLGGSLEIKSEHGTGSSFVIRLPLTLAISEALLVKMEEDIYAVPHTSIEGVVRVSRDELQECYEGRQEGFEYAGHTYLVRYLGSMLGVGPIALSEGKKWFPMLLVRSGDRRVAVQVDGLLGNRQIVVKSVGPQLSTVRWITGGTILGDGRVALILDVNAMVRMDAAKPLAPAGTEMGISADAAPVKVMVVDDSITVRKVTGRLLERHNFQVTTAKDGVDAVALLQEHVPDLMLLDIEMPRMDGFELARHMQASSDLKDIPIIMITSRTGEKHRKLAMELGVKGYLGKPYQEMELLENIYSLLAEAQA